MIETLKDVDDFKDKKVLLRVDFDVPVSSGGVIEETFRVKRQKPMINYLVAKGAITIMVAHISDKNVGSFSNLIPQFREILGHDVKYFADMESLSGLEKLPSGFVGILNKIRDYTGEVENSGEFAQKLAKNFDFYINNAFAVSHRAHASVSAITKFLPAYGGLLIEEETVRLEEAINAPKEGKIVVIGGAKASTKVPVIKNFLNRADKILLGGVVVNDILKERGEDIGDSVADENSAELLAGLNILTPELVIPDDFVKSDNKMLDIGPKTIDGYRDLIKSAKMVIWNGPLGLFEDDRFALGTNSIAEAIAGLEVPTIIGGGDTIAAVNKLGLLDKFDFVSTGGGAMLAFLAGEKLPGLEALGYYESR